MQNAWDNINKEVTGERRKAVMGSTEGQEWEDVDDEDKMSDTEVKMGFQSFEPEAVPLPEAVETGVDEDEVL